jgi:hypothetical protein
MAKRPLRHPAQRPFSLLQPAFEKPQRAGNATAGGAFIAAAS